MLLSKLKTMIWLPHGLSMGRGGAAQIHEFPDPLLLYPYCELHIGLLTYTSVFCEFGYCVPVFEERITSGIVRNSEAYVDISPTERRAHVHQTHVQE